MLSPSRLTVAVPLLALGALALTGCSSGSSKTASVAAPATTESSAPSTAPAGGAPTTIAAAPAAGTAMKIASFAYDPTPLTVAPGVVIAVTNTDGAEHTVTSDLNGLFANDIAHGKTITFTAPTKAGTYRFHCEYHASMHGTLIVKP